MTRPCLPEPANIETDGRGLCLQAEKESKSKKGLNRKKSFSNLNTLNETTSSYKFYLDSYLSVNLDQEEVQIDKEERMKKNIKRCSIRREVQIENEFY